MSREKQISDWQNGLAGDGAFITLPHPPKFTSLQFTVYIKHLPLFLRPNFGRRYSVTALQRYSVTLRIFHYADFEAREHY